MVEDDLGIWFCHLIWTAGGWEEGKLLLGVVHVCVAAGVFWGRSLRAPSAYTHCIALGVRAMEKG
jgi:hypothetical protein